jgi:hypothetical protein
MPAMGNTELTVFSSTSSRRNRHIGGDDANNGVYGSALRDRPNSASATDFHRSTAASRSSDVRQTRMLESMLIHRMPLRGDELNGSASVAAEMTYTNDVALASIRKRRQPQGDGSVSAQEPMAKAACRWSTAPVEVEYSQSGGEYICCQTYP